MRVQTVSSPLPVGVVVSGVTPARAASTPVSDVGGGLAASSPHDSVGSTGVVLPSPPSFGGVEPVPSPPPLECAGGVGQVPSPPPLLSAGGALPVKSSSPASVGGGDGGSSSVSSDVSSLGAGDGGGVEGSVVGVSRRSSVSLDPLCLPWEDCGIT